MINPSKRWHFAPLAPANFKNSLEDLGPVLAQVLYNRGLTSTADVYLFLEGELPLHDPFQMKDMGKAVSRIRSAIRRKEKIVVYGDFDADGVTSTALLVKTLQALEADVEPYIPHRVDEGYGLNTPALLDLAKNGTKVVVTVDCGIRSVEEVEAGNAAGLDIIITDHHSIGDVLPPAYAVLDPKRTDCVYPEDMLAGVGVAFKLATALLKAARSQDSRRMALDETDLLDLVALGTVADLAPLDRFENRRLVQLGLKELAKAKRPGVYELMVISGIDPEKIIASNIGFMLGPRINAAGRLSSAMTAYQLLCTDDINEARSLAQQLQQLNQRRQDETTRAYDYARAMMKEDEVPLLIFAASTDFLPGIVGLVAGRLAQEFYRPAVIIEQGETEAHGSCRSIPELNITEALDQCADLLLRHGGHSQAAGFSILNENLPALQQRLMEIVTQKLAYQELRPSISIDSEVEIADITLALAQHLQLLEPTGVENPSPIFATHRLKVMDARTVGRDNSHLKLRLGNGSLPPIDAIAFGFGHMLNHLSPLVDVAYNLEINEWQNRINVQMNVIDLRPSDE